MTNVKPMKREYFELCSQDLAKVHEDYDAIMKAISQLVKEKSGRDISPHDVHRLLYANMN